MISSRRGEGAVKRIWVGAFLMLFIVTEINITPAMDPQSSFSTSSTWWGASISDVTWYPWGSYFKDVQICILKEAGVLAIRLMLDKHPWDTKNSENCLGLPYPDYIKEIVELCRPELKVELELTQDSSLGEFNWTQKEEIIRTPSLRAEWINWGKEVVAHCKPDAINIMGEPGGGGTTLTFDYYYDNFVIPSINAYRSVDLDVAIFVMGMPFYDLSGFFGRPINDSKVYYCLHVGYHPSYNPTPIEIAYVSGDFVLGKQLLFDKLDEKIGPLPKSRVCIHEFFVGWQTPYPHEANWKVFAKDLYDYVSMNQMLGLIQYTIGKNQYLILDPNTEYTTFTEYGKLIVFIDINGDGVINIKDLFIVSKAFHSKLGDDNWNHTADVDKNDIVDILDLYKIARKFGKPF